MTAGPTTSPMLPPIPWNDSAVPRRWEKWWERDAIAGRCQSELEMETMAMPSSRTPYTGETPITSQPSPNPAIHNARTSPQYRRRRSAMIPPGRVMSPDTTSRTAAIPPTSTAPSPKVSLTSGSITRKLWFTQWKTPRPLLSPVRMKDALCLRPDPSSSWWT